MGLTEIQNVVMKTPFQEIPSCSGYIEINDQIIYNYEKVLDNITLLKQSKYNKMKQERKVESVRLQQESMASSDTDYYIDIVNNIALNDTRSRMDVTNVIYDNTHTMKMEEDIKRDTCAYVEYIDMIHDFLHKIDYLYVDNKHLVTREILMTSKGYQQYLSTLFDEIQRLSVHISTSRMNDEKYKTSLYSTVTKNRVIKNARLVTNEVSHVGYDTNEVSHVGYDTNEVDPVEYFNQFYEFTDDNIIRDKQKLLKQLITLLLVLIANVKNTYQMLNAIIYTYVVNDTDNEKYRKQKEREYAFTPALLNSERKYKKQRKANQLLLPTSWTESIKSYFFPIQKNNELKSPLNDYFRYISFYFEQNQIKNDFRINDVQYDKKCDSYQKPLYVDYVKFLFGPGITNGTINGKDQVDEDELYTSLYATPYEKNKHD